MKRTLLIALSAGFLCGCIDEADICVGHYYELVIQNLPSEIDVLTFELEFESQTIEATCSRQSDDSCGSTTDQWRAEMGFATDTNGAWVKLDDHERASSHVPQEIRVVLSSSVDPNFGEERMFMPEIETSASGCEFAKDLWVLN